MIAFRIFKLLDSRKSLFINRCLKSLTYRTSHRCISLRAYRCNVSELGINGKCVARRFGSHESPQLGPEQPKRQERNPVDGTSHHHHTITILQRLHDLEESFRVRGHSILRWGLSALVVAGFAIYVFREPLRENVADEVADVASRSLGKATL